MTLEELTLEVLELKKAIAELQRQLAINGPAPKRDWLGAVLGKFKDDPEYDLAVEAGRQFRATGYIAPPQPEKDAQ